MKVIINESAFHNIMRDFEESFKFDKWGKFKWRDDKDPTGAYTSMVTKDDEGNVRFSATPYLLPKSQVLAHNLFSIYNFNVTGALKHNRIKKPNEPEPREVTPDKSIEDFKQYTGLYIVKYLIHLKKDIDVILTPQSSSKFNREIAETIAGQYEKYFRKKITIVDNAFVKTPHKAQVDIEYGKQYMKQDIQKLYAGAPEEQIEKILQKSINDVYDLVKAWQLEGNIEQHVKTVYDLKKRQRYIIGGRVNIPPCKQKKVKEIQEEIDLILNLLETQTDPKVLHHTKYYHYNKLADEPKKFEVKSLPDGIRQSLYHLLSLSNQPDECYTYTKGGETIAGKSAFIDKLKRNNKTILIFDDNLSSGRTMDDAALTLTENGISKDNIVIITLGVVPKGYSKHTKYYRA